jgi:hypothetical protein
MDIIFFPPKMLSDLSVSYGPENMVNCSLRASMYNIESAEEFLVETVVTDGICQTQPV